MIEAGKPGNEKARLEALHQLEILDTEMQPEFDAFVKLAGHICGTPVALISLVDTERQWFKAKIGVEETQTDRNISFCGHAILGGEVMVVNDTILDPRFFDNPLVIAGPKIRFYAGAPLTTKEGFALGTLCALAPQPKELDAQQLECLSLLAKQVTKFMEARKTARLLKHALTEIKVMKQVLPICAGCKKIRNDDGGWDMLEDYISAHADTDFTHGICPDCVVDTLKGFVAPAR